MTAAGTGVNKPPLTGVPRTVRNFLAALVVAAPFSVAVASDAQAQDVTCQGQAATVVGPTDGFDTVGTEGDDVIVAPVGNQGRVLGLGGNDTICLVDGASGPSRDPIVSVEAGAGNDTVHNLRSDGTGSVELGPGADTYVGNDFPERVYGSMSWPPEGDTDIDVFQTGGGVDVITSGAAGVANHDSISTGAGSDSIWYGGTAAGALLDNGPTADSLYLVEPWTGELVVDNVARRASIGGSTVLSWTSLAGFSMRAVPGSRVTFVGSDADEALALHGSVRDLAAHAAVSTGRGDDIVRLEDYLPSSVDLGEGYDSLTYLACHRAYVSVAVSAECLGRGGEELSTALAGIESFHGETANGLTVQGSDQADRITAIATYVLVRSGRGADRVHARGARTTQVVGGRGADRIKGLGRRGVVLHGGRGADVLRGDRGPDELSGDLGRDVAWGQLGEDECEAEVRHGCE